MKRQQKLKEFFQSDQSSQSEQSEEDDLYEPTEDEFSKKKRGRPTEPLKWTRVFKITRNFAEDLQIFEIDKDQIKFEKHYNQQSWPENNDWKPLFNPQDFDKVKNQLRCQDYELNLDELLSFAKQVTEIRNNLSEKADKVRQLEGEDQMKDSNQNQSPPTQYRRSYSGPKTSSNHEDVEEDLSFKYQATNPKRKIAKQLSNIDLIDISHDAIVKFKSNDEIASKYQVKKSFVSQLVYKMKQDHKYLNKKFVKEELQEKVNNLIIQVTREILNSGQYIWRAQQVQKKLLDDHEVEVSLSKIRYVFKNQLSLKYKKIKKIPFLGNAQRCLVMRHLYAKQMIDIYLQGKTVWNFDESFINESFFARKKWCEHGQQNSIPAPSVSPRIAIFLVMNNHGDAYLSLSQSFTDSDRVMLFFEHFFKLLDLAQPDWRQDSILLMDNAKYHVSEETVQYFRRCNVNVFFSAPYSYDGAPCEMWFSYLKNEDLNPNNLKTGKRQAIESILTKVDLFQMQ